MSRIMAGKSDYYLTGVEIQEIMGCKRAKASSIIAQLNHELAEKGYITIGGKVPVKYFTERIGYIDADAIYSNLKKAR